MRRIMKFAAAGLLAVAGVGMFSGTASAHPPGGGIPQPFPPGPFPPGPDFPRDPGFPRPFPPRPMDTDYVVMVRHGNHWHQYGRYETMQQARRVEFYLERQGRQARIVPVRDYTPDFPWGGR